MAVTLAIHPLVWGHILRPFLVWFCVYLRSCSHKQCVGVHCQLNSSYNSPVHPVGALVRSWLWESSRKKQRFLPMFSSSNDSGNASSEVMALPRSPSQLLLWRPLVENHGSQSLEKLYSLTADVCSKSLGVREALKFGTLPISFYLYSEPTFVFTQKSTSERATCRIIWSLKIMEKNTWRQVLRDPVVFVEYQSQRYSLKWTCPRV